METISPVTSGAFSVHYDGVSYTRSTTEPLRIIEKTGDDDRVVNYAFNTSSLFNMHAIVVSATLNWGVASVVAGTGAVSVKIVAGTSQGEDDDIIFASLHGAAPTQLATAAVDSVGSKASALNSTGLSNLQTRINSGGAQFGIGLAFAPGASANEEITLNASPTLDVTINANILVSGSTPTTVPTTGSIPATIAGTGSIPQTIPGSEEIPLTIAGAGTTITEIEV